MGEAKPGSIDLRAREAWKAEQRRSRRRLAWIIAFSIVVPIATTAWFIGPERVRSYVLLCMVGLFVLAPFLLLFRKPIPKSKSSWTEPPAGPPGTSTYG